MKSEGVYSLIIKGDEMDRVLVVIVDNEDGTFSIMLDESKAAGAHVEIKCDNQYRANAVYMALIGNATNVK